MRDADADGTVAVSESPSHDGALARIAARLGPDVVPALASLAPTDLQTVLLEVHRQQAGRVRPQDLLRRYASSRFVRPSIVDPRALSELERVAWSLLPDGYEAITLSPVCPLGTSSVVAAVDQNKCVATDRNVEVVSDSTNVLALEAALRRRTALRGPVPGAPVRLASSQRQVRAQQFGDPRSVSHFQLLGLVAAGRRGAGATFECDEVVEQVRYIVGLLARWRPAWTAEVRITDFKGRSRVVEEGLVAPLRRAAPRADVHAAPERAHGRGYYVDISYQVLAVTESGATLEIADGGSVDWTTKLLSDRRERLVIGGVGIERLVS